MSLHFLFCSIHLSERGLSPAPDVTQAVHAPVYT
jgi:hypothetical protein